MLAMQRSLFLLTVLLLPSNAEDGVKTIRTFAGRSVILPCHIDVTDDLPTIEWSKEGLGQYLVLLYRDGCETHDMKDPSFWYRTSLIMNELKNGNISLRISDVQLSDAGNYICKTIRKKPQRNVLIELIVDAVSEPKLLFIQTAAGGVTLQCEASCWLPKPEITFLDDRGDTISADKPMSELDPRGCFNITTRVTLQTATSRVSCRVHQPDTDQTRVTDVFIPDGSMRSCTKSVIITVLATSLLGGFGLLIVICIKRFLHCGNACSAGEQKFKRSSDDISRKNDPVKADDIGGAPTADLLSIPIDEEDLRRSLLAGDQMPRQRPAASLSASTQSCPAGLGQDAALFPVASSPSHSDGPTVSRSNSLSVPSSGPKRAKPKRRYTTSAVSPNLLDSLTEDLEPILPENGLSKVF